ncbi:MAG: hypothetical protein ACMXYK_04780 [Candidatus Woesearchaeota archaeon]
MGHASAVALNPQLKRALRIPELPDRPLSPTKSKIQHHIKAFDLIYAWEKRQASLYAEEWEVCNADEFMLHTKAEDFLELLSNSDDDEEKIIIRDFEYENRREESTTEYVIQNGVMIQQTELLKKDPDRILHMGLNRSGIETRKLRNRRIRHLFRRQAQYEDSLHRIGQKIAELKQERLMLPFILSHSHENVQLA